MCPDSNIDRELFQNVLAAAFTMQQHLEMERLTQKRSNTIDVAADPLHDQITLTRFEEDDQSDTINALIEEISHDGERFLGDNVENSEPRCCDDTEAATGNSTPAPGSILPSRTDILDLCFPASQAYQPEAKTARLRLRDLSMPLQLILLIAMAVLLGWVIGYTASRMIAVKKGSPHSFNLCERDLIAAGNFRVCDVRTRSATSAQSVTSPSLDHQAAFVISCSAVTLARVLFFQISQVRARPYPQHI